MSQKLLSIFLFLGISISCSAQLCPDCVYEIEFNDNVQFWEDPDGLIFGADEIISPNKIGTWTFFEIDQQFTRIDLFTRDIYCSDGSIIRGKTNPSEGSKIYPNPVKNKLIIDAPFEEFFLTINSINGSRILSRNYQDYLEESIILNVSDLNPGIYILNLVSRNDQINHLFIVQ